MTEAAPASLAGRVRAIADASVGWGPGFAVAVASLYGVGFLVVNAYLGGFGVRDIEPLRTRYIATGISFTALAALTAAFGLRVHDFLLRRVSNQSLPAQLAAYGGAAITGTIVGSLILSFALTSLRSLPLGPLTTPGGGSRLIDVETFSFGAVLLVLVIRARRRDWHTLLGSLQTLTAVGALTSAMVAYANTIYPALPTWSGGGRADDVQLVLTDASAICPECVTGFVKLLDDDVTRVIVLIESPDGTQRAVEIGRAAVRSITHRPIPPRP